MSKKKTYFRKGFRKNKRTSHPAYLIDDDGNLYKFIGVTHSPKTDNIDNIPLHKNPNPNDVEKAFIRPFVEKDKPRNFGRRYKNWEFSTNDAIVVERIIDDDKKRKK